MEFAEPMLWIVDFRKLIPEGVYLSKKRISPLYRRGVLALTAEDAIERVKSEEKDCRIEGVRLSEDRVHYVVHDPVAHQVAKRMNP